MIDELRTSVVLKNADVNSLKTLERFKGQSLSEILRQVIKSEIDGSKPHETSARPVFKVSSGAFEKSADDILSSEGHVTIALRDFGRWLKSHRHVGSIADRIRDGRRTRFIVSSFSDKEVSDITQALWEMSSFVPPQQIIDARNKGVFSVLYQNGKSSYLTPPNSFIIVLSDDYLYFSQYAFLTFPMGISVARSNSEGDCLVTAYRSAFEQIFKSADYRCQYECAIENLETDIGERRRAILSAHLSTMKTSPTD